MVQNPHMSLAEIGERVGLSHVSVRSRINKMKQKFILEKRVLINPETLNLEIAYLSIKTENEEKKANLVSLFEKCPRVFFLGTIIGHYDIYLGAVAEDRAILELLRSRDYCLLRFPGILESEIRQQANLIKPSFLPIPLPICPSNSSIAPCDEICVECEKFSHHICVGCPQVKEYKGRLQIKPKE
jgi:DNA-binding Lrp family transcriptional regulator